MKKLKQLISQPATGVSDSTSESTDSPPEISITMIWWKKAQAVFAIFLKVFLAFLFVMLLIYTIIELFRYDLVIKPFEMPFQLGREGYTGTVVAHRLQDEMDNIREKMNRSSARGAVQGIAAAQFTELQKQQHIEIPTVGLSLNTIIHQIRKMLGIKQRHIKGDVVRKGEQFYMTLRITGKPAIPIRPHTNIDVVIKRAAKEVVKRLEALTFGLNYYINNKQEALKSLIDQMRQVDRFQKTTLSDKEEAIVLTLEACLLKLQAKRTDEVLLNKALKKFNDAQDLAPKIRAIYRMKGDTRQDLKEFDKAIAEYKKAIEIDTRLAGGIYVQWALALIEKRKQIIESAQFKNDAEKQAVLARNKAAIIAKYEEAKKKDPDNPWVYASWGERLALEFKDYAAAYEKFAIAQEKNPNYALTHAHWGDALQKQGDQQKSNKETGWREKYHAAIEEYEQAVKLDSSIAWIYGNWAKALYGLGEYEKAVVQYQKAIKLDSSIAWMYGNWAKALYRLGEYEKAIVPYQKAIELKPNDWWNYTGLCGTLYHLNRYEETINTCQDALVKRPESHWSRLRLLEAFFMQNQWQNALTECQTLLAASQIENKLKAAAHALCGVTQLKLNQFEVGMKNCQTALTLNKGQDFAYWCFGDAFMLKKQAAAAAGFYEKAVDLKPKKVFYYYKWGKALAASEEYDKAITAYQKAIEFDNSIYFRQDIERLIEKAEESLSMINDAK
jgi:tetratricopeptide (TPR) repeat protein